MARRAPVALAVARAARRARAAAAQPRRRHHVVHVQPDPDSRSGRAPSNAGTTSCSGRDQVRRELDHQLALEQRLADQPEVEVLQVAQPAVDELRRAAAGPRGEVGLLDERHAVAARGRVERHAGAGDPAADHDDVELAPGQGLDRALAGEHPRRVAAPPVAAVSPQPSKSGVRLGAVRLLPPALRYRPRTMSYICRRGLLVAGAARRPAGVADPDLDVRRRGDADVAAADLGDRLAGGHVRADRHQRRRGMAVVDVAALVGPAGDLEDRRVGPEAVDPLLDDRAGGHRDLDHLRAAGGVDGADVDPLVERPVARRQHPRQRLSGNTQLPVESGRHADRGERGRPSWSC